jgi:hypothetical protein
MSDRCDNTAPTETAAESVLPGGGAGQYDTLFAQVREQAPAQKPVLKSEVTVGALRVDGTWRISALVPGWSGRTRCRQFRRPAPPASGESFSVIVWQLRK